MQDIMLIIGIVTGLIMVVWIFKSYFKIDIDTLKEGLHMAKKTTPEHLPSKYLSKRKQLVDNRLYAEKYSVNIVGNETITESNSAMSRAYFDGVNENPAHVNRKSSRYEKVKMEKLMKDARLGKLNDIANESIANQPCDKQR